MKKILVYLSSAVLLLGGLLLILNVGWPILSYELFTAPSFQQSPELVSPVSPRGVLGEKSPYPLNLTRASNWFVGAPSFAEEQVSQIKYYTVAIPKLKILEATAEIGGDDLSRSLIHFKGTALPGRAGNTVIFGHSVLPQFFNPKNYLSIFSTLPTLKVGEEITVNYDGITYTYKIEQMYEVAPTDIQVLEQRYDDSYLTLITCVPPGTYLRRLVVKGRLVS